MSAASRAAPPVGRGGMQMRDVPGGRLSRSGSAVSDVPKGIPPGPPATEPLGLYPRFGRSRIGLDDLTGGPLSIRICRVAGVCRDACPPYRPQPEVCRRPSAKRQTRPGGRR